jgi:hypothetical protein
MRSRGDGRKHEGGVRRMCIIRDCTFRLGKMGNVVVWRIAIVHKGISKVAAWATHGGGEGEKCN